MFKERVVRPAPGLAMIVVFLLLIGAAIWLVARSAETERPAGIVAGVLLFLVGAIGLGGIFIVNPNEAKVLTLFGRYAGSVKEAGLWFVNPFTAKRKISLRVRNFETAKLKVNDSHGNPIDIGTVIVWQVVDTAEALFQVDDYENYVKVQSEAALRGLASSYPYDAHGPDDVSLSVHPAEVSKTLQVQVQERLAKAGVEVLETRISHLAYAQEIAQSMLQRQQAAAIIAARQKIVEGAVGMVETALGMLSERRIVQLDDERRAAMVSNLLVVLCSERATQPIVNTGTLYS
jgi:regulator of protease activity HflC (stomatin/prohibitin superfamily)